MRWRIVRGLEAVPGAADVSGVALHTVSPAESEQRLDRWFKQNYPEVPFGKLQKLFRTGQVRLDGKRVKGNERLQSGQEIRVPPLDVSATPKGPPPTPKPKISKQDAEALQAAVLFKDDQLLAINKPAGLAVQGGSGQSKHLDGLLPALQFEKPQPPKLVHRLDRDTSGVLLLARTARAARALTRAFRQDEVKKLYWAAVKGVPRHVRGTIDLALSKGGGKDGGGAKEKMQPDDAGQEAVTHYVVVDKAGKRASWLALRPVTGRTHQLRVHCAAMGHPILGDGKYGGKAAHPGNLALPGQLLLHARQISFTHPDDGTTLRLEAPLPDHMMEAWRALGFEPENPRGDPFEE